MKKKIIIISIIAILTLTWMGIVYSDYTKVAISYDKPKFCLLINGADDGGSGKYIGLGYSFNVDGHLETNGKYEVDTYTYKIFGITIKRGEANPNKG